MITPEIFISESLYLARNPGPIASWGLTLKAFGWGCAAETLTLNQIKFSYILQPYTRLKTKNSVTIPVQPKQNLLHCTTTAKTLFLKCQFPGNLVYTKFFKQLISFLENDTLGKVGKISKTQDNQILQESTLINFKTPLKGTITKVCRAWQDKWAF